MNLYNISQTYVKDYIIILILERNNCAAVGFNEAYSSSPVLHKLQHEGMQVGKGRVWHLPRDGMYQEPTDAHEVAGVFSSGATFRGVLTAGQ